MTRTAGLVCGVSLLAVLPIFASTGQTPAAEPAPVTRTATIEAVDKANRSIALKGTTGASVEIKAPRRWKGSTA